MAIPDKLINPLFIESHADYPAWRQHFLKCRLDLGIMLGLIVLCSFAALNISRYPSEQFQLNWLYIHCLQIISLLLCWGFLQTRWMRSGVALLWFSCSLTLLPQLIGISNGYIEFNLVLWSMVFMGLATLTPGYWQLHALSQSLLAVVICFMFFGLGLELHSDTMKLIDPVFYMIYMFWFCVICTLAVFLYERLQRGEFEARHQLKAEQEKSDRLLLNILPYPIAQRLKTANDTIADSFTEVSVMFTDLVGFTELSSRLEAPCLVKMLNNVFSHFDHLVEKRGLEKIKTIGDAYMVVAGLPEPQDDHADRMAFLALDMKKAIEEFECKEGVKLKIRIGIHSGPVVAGVIGIKKFAYDLWGDTVNVASRMESHSLPGEIQISEQFYQALHGSYQVEARGFIKIKGKGDMQTYFLRANL